MTKLKRSVFVVLFVTMGAVANLSAQSASPDTEQEAPDGTERISTDNDQQGESSVKPLVDGLFAVRNRVGFSVSATEYYASTPSSAATLRQSGSYASANASMYSNFKRLGSEFHIDYTFGYRRDNKGLHLTRATHTGSLSWSWAHPIGRRWTVGMKDLATSTVYDYDTTFSPFAYQVQQPFLLTQDIFVIHQKATRNVLTLNTDYRIGRQTQVGIFASDEFVRYQNSIATRAHVVQVGLNASHQLTKYLFIGASYTTAINEVNHDTQGSSIQRLRVLTFNFRRRIVDIFTSGGVQYARNPGSQFAADAEAGMTIGSQSTGFTLRYNHGFLSILGVGAAVETDTAHAAFTQKMGTRLSFAVNSDYMRFANGTSSTSRFQNISAGGGVQLELVKGLIFSVNHNYISQLATNVGFQAPRLNRQASSATIHYVLPPLRLR